MLLGRHWAAGAVTSTAAGDCWGLGKGLHWWFDKCLPGACPAQTGCSEAALGEKLETDAVTVEFGNVVTPVFG